MKLRCVSKITPGIEPAHQADLSTLRWWGYRRGTTPKRDSTHLKTMAPITLNLRREGLINPHIHDSHTSTETGEANFTTSLTSEGLLVTKILIERRGIVEDGVMDYYLIRNGGEQSYRSAHTGRFRNLLGDEMQEEEGNHIHQTYANLDLYLDLDFNETHDVDVADTTIQMHMGYHESIWDPEPYNGTSNTKTSCADFRREGNHQFWNILWSDMPNTRDRLSQYEKSSLLHEIGHTLGLSHPFEDGNHADYTTADSIMSYWPVGGEEAVNASPYVDEIWRDDSLYASGYTPLDIATMQQLWGTENDFKWIEESGRVQTVSDYKDRIAVIEKDDSRHYIQFKGVPIMNSKELMVIGAETINGINEVALQNQDGIITFWQCDADWNYERVNGASSLEHPSITIAENEFMQDFTMNGIIGDI